MREVAFIKQNKEKWLEFEQLISNKEKKSPDDIANLHIKIMNDLVYAQTYYPKSKVTLFLNKLAKTSFDKVYDAKRTDKNVFLQCSTTLLYLQKIYLHFLYFLLYLFFCGIIVHF